MIDIECKSDLVSVYITTKNRPEYLERALNSLVRQTYKNIEVLVCNDGSDRKFKNQYSLIVDKFQSSFNDFVYIENEISQGACAARNILIDRATGRYITGLDDDDYFFENRVELFLSLYKDEYAFVCGASSFNSKKTESYNIKDLQGHKISFEQLKNSNVVGNQIFTERYKIIENGGFDRDMPAWQDYDLWFRLLIKYRNAYKLEMKTMFVDVDTNRERITTSSNAYLGYLKFINKHRSLLNENNLIHLKYNDLLHRKQKFSLLNIDLIKRPILLLSIFKRRLSYECPSLYFFLEKIKKYNIR